jgi:hypothetical protein
MGLAAYERRQAGSPFGLGLLLLSRQRVTAFEKRLQSRRHGYKVEVYRFDTPRC